MSYLREDGPPPWVVCWIGLLLSGCGGSSSPSQSTSDEDPPVQDENGNYIPQANAGRDVITPSNRVLLDGRSSSDADQDSLTYYWALQSNGNAELENANTATPTLRLSDVGEFVVELEVTDSSGAKDRDRVVVRRQMPKTHNAMSLPDVSFADGQYRARLVDNANNITTHFDQSQGRLDYWEVKLPFEAVVRNVGIAPLNNASAAHGFVDSAYNFAGLQVHVPELDEASSAHVVVGHRGNAAGFTIEAKNTVEGYSLVNDIGANRVPVARADLRLVGDASGQLKIYWQLPRSSEEMGTDRWIPYGVNGNFPGSLPDLGRSGDTVLVGLITYAYFEQGIPFMGVADSIQIFVD